MKMGLESDCSISFVFQLNWVVEGQIARLDFAIWANLAITLGGDQSGTNWVLPNLANLVLCWFLFFGEFRDCRLFYPKLIAHARLTRLPD